MKVTGKRIVRTEVEFSPAKLIVKQIVQQVAKCTECGEKGSPNVKSHFQKAAVPVPPLAHSISTPSLIAQVMNAAGQTGKRLVPAGTGTFQKQHGELGDKMQSGMAGTGLLEDS